MTDMMIDCFFAAMETLNFTTAAEMVHITQPAFSRNIVQLEEEVGFPLFLRSKKNGLRVTPAGLEYYSGLVEMKNNYNTLLEKAKRINRGEAGELVIGVVTGSCVDSKAIRSINAFKERYPSMRVTLKCYSVSHMLEALDRGDCDLCFMISAAVRDREDLLAEDVFEIENYVFVPASEVKEDKDEYTLSDFKDDIFILSEDVPMINILLSGACKEAGFVPNTITAPDFETKMLWCELGMGIAINGADHYMKNSPNIKLLKVKEIKPDSFSVVWHKNNYNPGIALFYTMFCELMSS